MASLSSPSSRLPACLFWPFVTPSGAVDEAGIHVICATGTWSRGIEASPKLQVLNFFFSRAIRPLSTLGSRGKKRSRPSPGARQRMLSSDAPPPPNPCLLPLLVPLSPGPPLSPADDARRPHHLHLPNHSFLLRLQTPAVHHPLSPAPRA
ncbi:hypothetical protein CIHG_07204 [Coccidioides immitis H538.4]|uniref:Uncharacterized protein n=1 Tax=Coccidioides immitis H538.4 TaxID=396776 RepID=A0A0J8UPF2_COCIT|nr:hypothetical protein CIHG_07204 [Coccidioides immitis H538.4]